MPSHPELHTLDMVEDAARGIRAIAVYLGIVAALSILVTDTLGFLVVPLFLGACVLAWAVRARQSRFAASVLLLGAAIVSIRAVQGLLITPRNSLTLGSFTWVLVTSAWLVIGVQAVRATLRFHTMERSSRDGDTHPTKERAPKNGA